LPATNSRYLIDNNIFIAATKTGWTRSTDLLVHLLDGPNELICDEVLFFEYSKWAKIVGVHDLFNYLERRVIINNPIEGEISKCAPFFEMTDFADMIHAATCLGTNAILITNDGHFDRIKTAKLIEVWSIPEAISKLSPPINPP
jgi:predicted nucleic acid-binding protein